MSGDLYPVAGSHIDIGGPMTTQLADFSAADFASQTWTDVSRRSHSKQRKMGAAGVPLSDRGR